MSKKGKGSLRPFVSVICPTYNRRKFLPNLLHQFKYQTYPQEYMELIIIDDSPTSNEDIIPVGGNIKYEWLPKKMALGEKRNYINSKATGDIIVCFDDDDYYAPERVSHAVDSLMSSRKLLAGSSIIHIYYKNDDAIYEFGPYGANHGTNGTMAYKKEYLLNHSYESGAVKAEEAHFTNKFSEPMVQLNPTKVMLCLAHDNNTVCKESYKSKGKETSRKLHKFFKTNDKKMIAWIRDNL